MRPRHDTIGSPTAARRLRHEFTPRPAKSAKRSRLRISVRDAAPELYDWPRAVLQWAEPRDAALLGAEPIGPAVSGCANAGTVDLFSSHRKPCGQTGTAGGRTSFR